MDSSSFSNSFDMMTEPVLKIRESVGNPTQSPQHEAKGFRQAAKYNCQRDEGHLSDVANRGK
jgi:hypothetical protein